MPGRKLCQRVPRLRGARASASLPPPPPVAPDIKAGDSVRFADGQAPVPEVNVYGFAYYIWQQINRWQTDGSKDYGQQIFQFQS